MDGYLVVAGTLAVGVLLVVAAYTARRLLAPSAPTRAEVESFLRDTGRPRGETATPTI